MLRRDLTAARIGDLVILPGSLTLANFRVFEQTLKIGDEFVPEAKPSGTRNERLGWGKSQIQLPKD